MRMAQQKNIKNNQENCLKDDCNFIFYDLNELILNMVILPLSDLPIKSCDQNTISCHFTILWCTIPFIPSF
jgi:hypothetical protein